MREKRCEICGRERRRDSQAPCPLTFANDFDARVSCKAFGYERLVAELAAAEERGRRRGVEEERETVRQLNATLAKAAEQIRRGVEERDELRKALGNAAAALALAGNDLARRLDEKRASMSTTEAVNDEVAEAVVRAARDASAALAPGDSGKVCGCREAVWYPARHAPNCPRKEGT